jgi:hypothetical protein
MTATLPIALMSFDRPDYLEAVIQTALRQLGHGGRRPIWFLFQDGAVGRRTGKPYADATATAESVRIFRSYIPDGEVFATNWNLGVAANFDRAERFMFVENAFDVAVFLEDDMLLQPHYMEVLVELLEMAKANPYIGMVSAYGARHDMPLAEQQARRTELCLMNEHNWAFGITRDCWVRRNAIVRGYLELLDGVEYRDRKAVHGTIEEMQRRLGRGGVGYLSSQDSIKNMACEVLDMHRVSTHTNNARYIGRKGLHMTAERFFKRGYHRTVLYPDPHGGFRVPSATELVAMRTWVMS